MKNLIAALALIIASPAIAADNNVYGGEPLAAAHAIAERAHGTLAGIRDTGSMVPTLTKQDIVVLVRDADPKVGDIVAFRLFGAVVCHRIVERNGDWLVTKGDALTKHDPAITIGQTFGVVVAAVDRDTAAARYFREVP